MEHNISCTDRSNAILTRPGPPPSLLQALVVLVTVVVATGFLLGHLAVLALMLWLVLFLSFFAHFRGAPNAAGAIDSLTVVRAETEMSGSIALMHVASGLFVQGHYAELQYETGTIPGANAAVRDVDATNWLVQAGITKNWTGMGNTSFYGEYGRAEDHAAAMFVATTQSDMKFYGLGVVQQIDAAAMEVYLGWRRFDGEESGGGLSFDGDLNLVHGGARIRF